MAAKKKQKTPAPPKPYAPNLPSRADRWRIALEAKLDERTIYSMYLEAEHDPKRRPLVRDSALHAIDRLGFGRPQAYPVEQFPKVL